MYMWCYMKVMELEWSRVSDWQYLVIEHFNCKGGTRPRHLP